MDDEQPELKQQEKELLNLLPPKEIVSYQRFGRFEKHIFSLPLFKCHLCGFNCYYKETLLKHFSDTHPN